MKIYNILAWEPNVALKQIFFFISVFLWISDMLPNKNVFSYTSAYNQTLRSYEVTSCASIVAYILLSPSCLRWIMFYLIFRFQDIFYFYFYLTFGSEYISNYAKHLWIPYFLFLFKWNKPRYLEYRYIEYRYINPTIVCILFITIIILILIFFCL